MATFIQHVRHEESGRLHIDMDDESTAATLVTREGAIVQPRLLEAGN